jgi:RimJ/RimL family protein N-acetyltransferase
MSDEIHLRDVEDGDLEFFFANEHDPENVRRSKFMPRPREKFLTHWATNVLGVPTNFVQTVTVDGAVAGHVDAWTQDDRRYIGYVFGRPFWGRGIGTRAVRMFVEREPTRPLYADPFTGNTASVKLLERCGFVRIGSEVHEGDEYVVLTLA